MLLRKIKISSNYQKLVKNISQKVIRKNMSLRRKVNQKNINKKMDRL
jgi:hypothetical protein